MITKNLHAFAIARIISFLFDTDVTLTAPTPGYRLVNVEIKKLRRNGLEHYFSHFASIQYQKFLSKIKTLINSDVTYL